MSVVRGSIIRCALAVCAVVSHLKVAADDYPPYQLRVPPAYRTPSDRQIDDGRFRWRQHGEIAYPNRLQSAYTIVLPGVLGSTPYNAKLVRLLRDADTAVEYFDWTDGVPLFMRRGLAGNRFAESRAKLLCRRIEGYQTYYPGRPVNVIGLCAGAGAACEAIARLPRSRQINRLILLGPALSPGYDLRPVLERSAGGIESFHSPFDIPVLMALTTVVGTVDGQHLPAAGAIGFGSNRNSGALRQHVYSLSMLRQGHLGGHFGWTASEFVEENVIPLLQPGGSERSSH